MKAFKPLETQWSSALKPPESTLWNYMAHVDYATAPPGSLQSIRVKLIDRSLSHPGAIRTARVQDRSEDEVFVRIVPLASTAPQ